MSDFFYFFLAYKLQQSYNNCVIYSDIMEGTRMNPNVRPESMERITTPKLANAFIEEH